MKNLDIVIPEIMKIRQNRGHDFKDFVEIFDRIRELTLEMVSLRRTHSGGLTSIVNDVFCAKGAP